MLEHLEFDYDVFISYSSHESDWVRGVLLKHIEQSGLRAFVDFRDFKRGAPSITEMERGVTTSRKTLLVLTPDYLRSEWCEIENIMAQTRDPANRDLRLIPLLKTKCEKPLRISALTHVDFTDGADLELAWRQLLAALDAVPDSSVDAPIPGAIQAELDRAKLLIDADKYAEALPVLERALSAADHSGHGVAKVKARLALALGLYQAREDFSGAERCLREALAMVPIRNLDLKHRALHGLGDMLLCSGRLDEAKAAIDAGLSVAKLTGKTDDLAASLISSSMLDRDLGFHDRAAAKLDEGMHVLLRHNLAPKDADTQGYPFLLAACYMNKAALCRDAGDLDQTLALAGKAEEQYRVSGYKLEASKALLFCGEVHCANADWADGFECFRRALEHFKEATNPLWGARALENLSRLYATHERWEEAVVAMLGAATGAEEAGHPEEQARRLLLAGIAVRTWKAGTARENVARLAYRRSKDAPEEKQPEVAAKLSAMTGEMSAAIERMVRDDEEVRDLLNQAKGIAQREHLSERLADCLLDEARNIVPQDDDRSRRDLIAQAVELLKAELNQAQSPGRRGHLMGRISELNWELDDSIEALSWLKRAGEIFEKVGDAFGLANVHASMAERYRAEGRPDEEIAAYRKVLSIVEGRSFHRLAAAARIKLAAALRYRQEFKEPHSLLEEAEALSERHRFKDLIPAIARIRSDIEEEAQAAQAPSRTLPQLLDSFRQLVEYRPELAKAYLAFWYFVWKTELLALVRSGPNLSFMVVTDDVDRFLAFAGKFRHLCDMFLMTTTHASTVKIDAGVLPIPSTWQFPATFPFLFVRRERGNSKPTETENWNDENSPPDLQIAGPATALPPYIMVQGKSAVKGEGRMMALSAPYLPQEALTLMLAHPAEELIERSAVWFPSPRSSSKDPFLTDLRVGHERGVFPVYFDRLPRSDQVAVCGGIQVNIPGKVLMGHHLTAAARWRRILLRLPGLPKDAARSALLDFPEAMLDTADDALDSTQVEIRLFEFSEIGQQICHPALLVQ